MPDSSSSERQRRRNGLSPPYTSAQVSTWVTLPTLVLEVLFFVSPIIPWQASIPVTIAFVALAVLASYYGILAMWTDPADPRLFQQERQQQSYHHHHHHHSDDADHKNGRAQRKPPIEIDPTEPTKHCWICDVTVAEKSMHCKFCNKCVHHFDHHCMCKFCIAPSRRRIPTSLLSVSGPLE